MERRVEGRAQLDAAARLGRGTNSPPFPDDLERQLECRRAPTRRQAFGPLDCQRPALEVLLEAERIDLAESGSRDLPFATLYGLYWLTANLSQAGVTSRSPPGGKAPITSPSFDRITQPSTSARAATREASAVKSMSMGSDQQHRHLTHGDLRNQHPAAFVRPPGANAAQG